MEGWGLEGRKGGKVTVVARCNANMVKVSSGGGLTLFVHTVEDVRRSVHVQRADL